MENMINDPSIDPETRTLFMKQYRQNWGDGFFDDRAKEYFYQHFTTTGSTSDLFNALNQSKANWDKFIKEQRPSQNVEYVDPKDDDTLWEAKKKVMKWRKDGKAYTFTEDEKRVWKKYVSDPVAEMVAESKGEPDLPVKRNE